jgi:hypothetical protein
MNLRNAAGAMSRFAHLSGLVRPAAKAADDDKPEDKKDDEKDKDAKAAEDDEDKTAKAAEDDEGDDKKPDDNDDDRKDDVEDDDEKPKDKDGKKAFAAGFKSAQARGAAIFGNAAAAGNPALAAELAFGTDIPAAQAVALLKVGASNPSRTGLASRMAGTKPINIGADEASDPPASKNAEATQLASRTLAAARAAGGKF